MPAPFALLGLPYDASSSFLRGAAGAPPLIRQALQSPSSNGWSERGADALRGLEDAGDAEVPAEPAAARAAIEQAVRGVLARGWRPLSLGGDHSVTYPILRAFAGRHAGLTVVHLDAHGDLYDEFEGDRYSHACPFARAMEEGLAARLIQIGVRTLNAHQQAQARRYGVEQYGMDRWAEAPLEALTGPVYVSLDLDVLDPAFAPGISHPEPGGLSVREVVSLIHRIGGDVVGADVVEYNPALDVRDLTARVAAKLIKEVVAGRESGDLVMW
ncbi:MAG: agmatinase [Vicinamibacterales bacterium]|nr:agmatinase [Vicinamibacterales bacterium]